MASPSALLNVLLKADTADATAKLTKFDKQLAAVDAKTRKGIEARLGGAYNPRAFEEYTKALDKAAARAKSRDAFKAELGANFNNRAFNQYQRALEKANAETDAADVKSRRFSGGLGAIGSVAKTAAIAVGAIGVGAAVVGEKSIRAAASFQQAMEMIHTQAHASQQQVDSLSKSVESLAPATATGPDQLADGLYHLISQGLKPGAKAMNALRVAAEGAKIGNADLVDVTNALGAVVASGVKGTSNLDKAMASLNATVGAGDMHMQDLADAFGTGLLGPMKRFGVNLQDVDAALAVFGDNNIRGADAGTKLGSAIRIMAAPSNAAAKSLKSIGIGATQLADDLRSGPGGLLKAMEDLKQHLQDAGLTASQQARVLTQAFGGRQSTGVQLLLGQLERLRTKEEETGKGALSLSDSWKATQKTLSVQIDRLKVTFETLAIKIGNAIGPPVLNALNTAASAVANFITQMQRGVGAGGQFAAVVSNAANFAKNLFDQFQKGNPLIVSIVGGLAGMVVAIKAASVAMAAFDAIMAANPLVLLVAAIGAVVGALVLLNAKNKAVHAFLVGAWNDIKAVAQAVFPTIATIVKVMVAITKIQFDLLKAYALAVFDVIKFAIGHTLIPAFNAIKGPVKDVGQVIGTVFSFIWHKAIKPAMDFILGAFADLLSTLATVANVKLPIVGRIFGNTGKAIQGAADNVRNLKDQLDGLPAKKGTEVDVKVNFLSNVAGAIDSISTSIVNVGNRVAGNVPRHYSGGLVTQPGYFAGEEAPQHPEVILATNPAYRSRNLGLWAAAGHMLGVPGFAKGGVSLANAGSEVGQIDPWTGQHAGSWIAGKAKAWIKNMFPGVSPNIASLAGLWQKGGGPGGVADIAAAIAMAESGGRNIKQQGQPYATTGWGLWQITPGNSEPQFGVDQALLIPINNARAAVAKYRQAGGNFNPWTTYRDGAYKAFLGGGGAAGGAAGATVGAGGLGRFDGLPVASWIIPELLYAQQHGWKGRITSGYRAGFDPHAPSGSEHALTQYPGGAVDFGGMVDPAGLANKLAFMAATAGYRGLRLLPASGFRDDGHMSGTGHYMGGIHGKMPHFAKGGIFGKAVRAAGKIKAFAKGGFTSSAPQLVSLGPSSGTFSSSAPVPVGIGGFGLPTAASVIGLPALPKLGGKTPTTIAGARGVAATLAGDRGTIAKLEQDFNSIDSYYSQINGSLNYTDPVTGAVDETAVHKRLDQLNLLIRYRERIFKLWGYVVGLTQRLIAANVNIVANLREKLKKAQDAGKRLRDTLAHISTKGLKGSALKNANKRITDTKKAIAANDKLVGDTKGDISKYLGNAASARGDLTTAIGDRQSAWISLQGLLGEKFSVAGTTAQPFASTDTGGSGAGGDTSGGVGTSSSDQSASLLSGLLLTAQQNFAVSQAQYKVLSSAPPFGGSFASGGVIPGPIGAPRTIIAHGGETVTPHGGTHVRVELHDDRHRVFVNGQEQAVNVVTRKDARNASRNLAGSRRRIGGM